MANVCGFAFCSFKCSCKGFSGKGSGKRFSGKGVANVLVAKVWQRCYATKTKGKRSATRLPLNTPLQPPTFATTNVCHKHPFTTSFASRQDFSAIIVMWKFFWIKAAPLPHLCHNRGYLCSFLRVSATRLSIFFIVLPFAGQVNTRNASFCFCFKGLVSGKHRVSHAISFRSGNSWQLQLIVFRVV